MPSPVTPSRSGESAARRLGATAAVDGRRVRDAVRDRGGRPELVDVRRFRNDWEKQASLQLRIGDTDVIDTTLRTSVTPGGYDDSRSRLPSLAHRPAAGARC